MNPLPPAERRASEEDVVLWQQTQNRVALYLTTNGILEISLCGLFVTAAAALVAFGKTQDLASVQLTFGLIIPVFSCVILALSANVYSWIRYQLEYIRCTAPHPRHHQLPISYEEWRVFLHEAWSARTRRSRALKRMQYAFKLYATLPLNINNIYRYYFLIYVSSGIASVGYAYSQGIAWYWIPIVGVIQFLLLASGTQEVAVLEAEGADIAPFICRYPTYTLEDLSDDY